MPHMDLRRRIARAIFGDAERPNGKPIRLAVVFFSFVFLAISNPAAAQDAKNVVVLETMTLPFLQGTTSWLRRSLTKLGYPDGEKIKYTVLNANGNFENA